MEERERFGNGSEILREPRRVTEQAGYSFAADTAMQGFT
jgi:hypothetical protein